MAQARVDTANQALSQDEAKVKHFTEAYEKDVQSFEAALTAYRASMPAGDPATIDHLESQWRAWVEVARGKLLPAGASF